MNSFRISWRVNNISELALTRYRIYTKFEDTIEFREWPGNNNLVHLIRTKLTKLNLFSNNILPPYPPDNLREEYMSVASALYPPSPPK